MSELITETAYPDESSPLTGRAVKSRMFLVSEAHALDLAQLRQRGFFSAPLGSLWTSEAYLGGFSNGGRDGVHGSFTRAANLSSLGRR